MMLAGGMAEWSMAVVLKTTKVQAFGGSNPSPSAKSIRSFLAMTCLVASVPLVAGDGHDLAGPR